MGAGVATSPHMPGHRHLPCGLCLARRGGFRRKAGLPQDASYAVPRPSKGLSSAGRHPQSAFASAKPMRTLVVAALPLLGRFASRLAARSPACRLQLDRSFPTGTPLATKARSHLIRVAQSGIRLWINRILGIIAASRVRSAQRCEAGSWSRGIPE
jgi:hypothetical protein